VAIATLPTLGTAVPEFARERVLTYTSLATLPNPLWEPGVSVVRGGHELDDI
jgi:hypothetical protein